MPNIINEMVVRDLTASLDSVEGMVIVSMAGLTVAETETLRDALAEEGVRLHMVRNRLVRRALDSRGVETPDDMFKGNVAMAWGSPEETIHAARVLSKSDPKKQGKVAFRGGLLDGNLLDASEASQLADLPTKDELRAMLLGVLSGPARSLVGLLAAPGGSLARVLQARVDSASEGDG